MKRSLEADLWKWRNHPRHMPLLVRGARQVGKTYLVEKFGKEAFENCVILNFEQHPEYKGCFTTLDPIKIISSIELLKEEKIQAGKTLLSGRFNEKNLIKI